MGTQFRKGRKEIAEGRDIAKGWTVHWAPSDRR